MKQLTFKIFPGLPVKWTEEIKHEIRRLRSLPRRGLHDYDSQISQCRIEKYLLKQKIEQELVEWKREGCPGYDPDRDARLTKLNQELITLEQVAEDLEHQREEVLRLAYLEEYYE